MKNIFFNLRILVPFLSILLLMGCVHDDKYDDPNQDERTCSDDFVPTMTLKELKGKIADSAFSDDDVIEAYVSSSDESGNIYKTIYLQDAPENPTQGLVVSVESTNNYANYPQGSKVYIRLKGLKVDKYRNVIQLGQVVGGKFGRIEEKMVASNIIRSCQPRVAIVPKTIALKDVVERGGPMDDFIGCLVKIENAEFDPTILCQQYAPDKASVDRPINDATFKNFDGMKTAKVVVRNSGYASFANKTLPSGKGDFIGVMSKFNSTYQFYIVNEGNLNMKNDRSDGIVAPCQADENAVSKTVAEVKDYFKGSLTRITDNATLTAQVIANDASGNIFKAIYVQDETGGIKININPGNNNTDRLYYDRRFQIGRQVKIGLKDLYINQKNGELNLGGLFKDDVGQIQPQEIYKHFYSTNSPIDVVVPTERTIASLRPEDVGRYVKIKGVQFIDADLGKYYADGNTTSSRTLEDCSGNTIILATNGRANFGNKDFPFFANATEVDPGKGDVIGILSYFKGKYQIWLLNLRGADFDDPRCDGTLPQKSNEIFRDGFDKQLANWSTFNLAGDENWHTENFGNPKPSAVMNGNRKANEDWLVSKEISLAGFKDPCFSFETDAKFDGKTLEIYVTDAFTDGVKTTNWTQITSAKLDTDLKNFGKYQNSGRISLKAYEGKSIRIAFRYTSEEGKSTIWQVDNVEVKGVKN